MHESSNINKQEKGRAVSGGKQQGLQLVISPANGRMSPQQLRSVLEMVEKYGVGIYLTAFPANQAAWVWQG